jgi:hypothetical protein
MPERVQDFHHKSLSCTITGLVHVHMLGKEGLANMSPLASYLQQLEIADCVLVADNALSQSRRRTRQHISALPSSPTTSRRRCRWITDKIQMKSLPRIPTRFQEDPPKIHSGTSAAPVPPTRRMSIDHAYGAPPNSRKKDQSPTQLAAICA